MRMVCGGNLKSSAGNELKHQYFDIHESGQNGKERYLLERSIGCTNIGSLIFTTDSSHTFSFLKDLNQKQ